MSTRLRRLQVLSLENLPIGASIALDPLQERHARVLRLRPSQRIEVQDGQGLLALAELGPDGKSVNLVEAPFSSSSSSPAPHLIYSLAISWPKGKRAAFLVEKSVELGVNEIVPLSTRRGVVSKRDQGESMARLRRIAIEAGKQSRRVRPASIGEEEGFEDFIAKPRPHALRILLDPKSPSPFLKTLEAHYTPQSVPSKRSFILWVLIGPEGGFDPEEKNFAREHGVLDARIGHEVLRVETAALAACAVLATWSFQLSGMG